MVRTRRYLTLLLLTTLLSGTVVPLAFAAEPALPEVVDAELAIEHVDVVDVGARERARVEAAPRARGVDAAPRARGDVTPSTTAATADAPEVAGTRTAAVEAPIAFTAVWAQLPEGLDEVAVRTSVDGESWTPWYPLVVEDGLQAPDAGTAEAAEAVDPTVTRTTDLLTTLEGRFVQLEADGDEVSEVTLGFLDAGGLNESTVARLARQLTPRPVPAEAATVPSWIEPRSAWGAAPYKGTPSIARDGVRQVVVHHTAGANNLANADGTGCVRSKVISTIRGIQRYHQDTQRWSDIGYNVVIDPCGGVWEARQGGLDRAVIGAHAAGYNTGSTGVSVLGNFTNLEPNARVLAALDRVVGWKAGIHGIDTGARVTVNGTSYSTVVGHREVGNTSCPGRITDHLGRIRTNAKAQASQWPRVPDGLGVARFSDTTGSTHAAAIDALVERTITDGFPDGTFRPGRSINRGQVATFLARALGLLPVPGQRFDDVGAGFVHEGAINALVDTGVLGGYPDGTFRPNEPLRREHMAVILTRALALDLRPEAAAVFSDVVGYAGEIGAIAEAKITSGRPDGTFQPQAPVTRGQMATFLMNAIGLLEARPEAPAPTDPDPTDPDDASPPSA